MYDLIIIGASAAGASAGIYAARRNLNFKIITKDTGGEVALSGEVANFPGFGETDGITISNKFQEHLKIYNIVPETDIEVEKIEKNDEGFLIKGLKMGEGVEYTSKTVIVASGVHPRHLNIPGEDEYRGKGVTYCTTCDGPLYKGKVVATIGGGNSALESALMLDEIANKVYLINKNPKFKGDRVLVEKVEKAKNVEIIYSAMTQKIYGDNFVSGLEYKDQNGEMKNIEVNGVFVHIGMIPNSSFVPDEVEKNEYGEIKINKICETNIPGFFAAGDVTDTPYKQIAIATGQGVCASLSVVDYLNKLSE